MRKFLVSEDILAGPHNLKPGFRVRVREIVGIVRVKRKCWVIHDYKGHHKDCPLLTVCWGILFSCSNSVIFLLGMLHSNKTHYLIIISIDIFLGGGGGCVRSEWTHVELCVEKTDGCDLHAVLSDHTDPSWHFCVCQCILIYVLSWKGLYSPQVHQREIMREMTEALNQEGFGYCYWGYSSRTPWIVYQSCLLSDRIHTGTFMRGFKCTSCRRSSSSAVMINGA